MGRASRGARLGGVRQMTGPAQCHDSTRATGSKLPYQWFRIRHDAIGASPQFSFSEPAGWLRDHIIAAMTCQQSWLPGFISNIETPDSLVIVHTWTLDPLHLQGSDTRRPGDRGALADSGMLTSSWPSVDRPSGGCLAC